MLWLVCYEAFKRRERQCFIQLIRGNVKISQKQAQCSSLKPLFKFGML